MNNEVNTSMIAPAEIEKRFAHHTPNEHQTVLYGELRKQFKSLAEYINANVPASRERSLALTKLEEGLMHANSGIARRS